MATSGYSATPLLKKLGILPGTKIRLVNPPDGYFDLFEVDLKPQVVKSGHADLIHLFAAERKSLEKDFKALITLSPAPSVIWISWYKKSAKIPTDITEDVIREIVLPTGWVDTKVCAVNDLWSGLKIVKRVSKR